MVTICVCKRIRHVGRTDTQSCTPPSARLVFAPALAALETAAWTPARKPANGCLRTFNQCCFAVGDSSSNQACTNLLRQHQQVSIFLAEVFVGYFQSIVRRQELAQEGVLQCLYQVQIFNSESSRNEPFESDFVAVNIRSSIAAICRSLEQRKERLRVS